MARIVMIGSGLEVRGGVSAMAAVCARDGLFERRGVDYLATHCDGSARRKLACAARAWTAFAARLVCCRVALLHVHLNSGASFWRKALFVLPALAARVPFVLHVHCGGFAAFYARRCGPAARALVRLLLRRARAVVALSEAAAAELRGIEARAAIHVIPNPVEVPATAAAPATAEPVVLFLGAIAPAKGVFDLLRAWPQVLAAVPGARLVLGGTGDVAAVRNLARQGGFEDSVLTPGWVGPAEKQSLLQRSAVFVLPSHSEAMPMALLEAMAAGLPAVATPVGAVPAMVGEGRCAVMVPVGDVTALGEALAALLRDPRERSRLGGAARERALQAYSSEAVLPRIEALWDAVASEAAGHRDAGNPRVGGRMDYAGHPVLPTGGQVGPPSLPGSRRIHPGAPHQ